MRRLLTAAVSVLTLVSLAACDAGDGGAERPTTTPPEVRADATATPSPSPSAASVPLDERYPAPDDAARVIPEGLTTLASPAGHQLTLVGAHRLAEDRLVVTGVLALDPDIEPSEFAINGFEEATLRRADAGGSEFAPFQLSVAGDPATYLPVRDDDDRCLCSVIRSGMQEQADAMPVMTVMSAPADAAAVDLVVDGFGEVDDVPVTPVPEGTTTPWGARESLTVRTLERADGVVTARVTVATPGAASGWGLGTYGRTTEQLCLAGVAVVGTGRASGLVEGCVRGVLPSEGEAVDLEITLPDPGTDQIVVLPSNGFPLALHPEGEPSDGGGERLVAHDARSRTEGATVARGEELEVLLDTSVLFDPEEAVLTPQARSTLDVAVQTLSEQDGRTLTVAGHTDSVGSVEDNRALSLARAEAVRDALAEELGEGWGYDVVGYGEDRLLVPETGSEEEIEAARASNRRVELTVQD